MISTRSPRSSTVVLAVLVTWLVWGSSFLAIDLALESIPPLLLMASRFVVAGLVATGVGLVLARRAGHPRPCRRAWRDAGVVGFGFVTIGMGATGWAATRLPSGVTALLVASAPLWIAALQARRPTQGRSPFVLLGLAAGMAGMALLVAPWGGHGPAIDPVAALVLVAANAAWAAASLHAPRITRPSGVLLAVGMQMLVGGVLLLAGALVAGEASGFDLTAVGGLAAGSWAYLVTVASLGAFVAYGWLLDHVGAGVAATHAFVNPLVAVALGALLLDEAIGPRTLVAAASIVAAVALLLLGERDRSGMREQRSTYRTRSTATLPHRRRRSGFRPSPTPAFARRSPRHWQATDGMDALAIDDAFERID